MLTQDFSLTNKLRVPAISRLQKVYNTDIALKAAHLADVEAGRITKNKYQSKDLVDGHKEKTLQLLWDICQLQVCFLPVIFILSKKS